MYLCAILFMRFFIELTGIELLDRQELLLGLFLDGIYGFSLSAALIRDRNLLLFILFGILCLNMVHAFFLEGGTLVLFLMRPLRSMNIIKTESILLTYFSKANKYNKKQNII